VRPKQEDFVGSSIQFHVDGIDAHNIPDFVDACMARGVELKWFGAQEPSAFTSRYDSWHYLDDIPHLPKTLQALSATCDMRVPLTFSDADCQLISEIIAEEAGNAIA
jgi:hypothetical protein